MLPILVTRWSTFKQALVHLWLAKPNGSCFGVYEKIGDKQTVALVSWYISYKKARPE